MTLLEFFFIISGIIILIIAFDIARKQKFNALHFVVFIGVGGGLLLFALFPNILNTLGNIFGVTRGADVLVYGAIIFLLYFVLLLLTKHVENKESITKLIREIAIDNSDKKIITGNEVFLVRAYNEASVIKGVLENIYNAGYKNILLINDGSKDNTKEILKNFADKIYIVNHSINIGAGAALETGFEYLRRYGDVKYVITFDADGQHDILDAVKFIDLFEKEPDLGVIFGSRFMEKTTSNVPFLRKITLFLGKIFTYFISGINLTDAHNGYRALRLDVVKNIHLTIDTMAYASELIDEVHNKKIRFKEVPVNITYTTYSLAKGQRSTNAINIVLRIIWSKFFR
ncbi:MAG: DUF2304 family protein [Candidatus Gracilibacteria bacterium]|nr:DUF2304 family protein [Candidatus Gracilibacteria bacterium]